MNQDDSIKKLKKEIDSWKSFSDGLRMEDKLLFRDMTMKLANYADAVGNSPEEDVTEALLLSLLLSQQKTINSLLAKLRERM